MLTRDHLFKNVLIPMLNTMHVQMMHMEHMKIAGMHVGPIAAQKFANMNMRMTKKLVGILKVNAWMPAKRLFFGFGSIACIGRFYTGV